ncbi:hypothetical protein NQ314_003787 [Rhamnusium bicolor]|uniref:Uncharacterized protein n=1 Tax=Rhamnusium bicolor TaxID=1586634 RepID=A0AAV8ZNX3_9CUCU|nr:hypothetical protein NQ314_003787 [Rhamnusium bicolor]
MVTDKSSFQHKASIQKLTSSDLKLLASTSLNLSELYKLKELSKNTRFIEEHTYNNLNVIENLRDTSSFSQIDDFSTFSVESEEKTVLYNIPSTIPSEVDANSRAFIENATDNTNEMPEIMNITTESEVDLER